MLYESTLYEVFKVVKDIEKRKCGGNQGPGVEENGKLLFNGYRVSVLQYESSGDLLIPT